MYIRILYKLTRRNQATGSPLLSPLLDHFKEILAIMIIPNQMDTVDNHDQWCFSDTSSVHGHLLQFVECTFNVQERSSIPGASNAEQTTNITGKPVFVNTLIQNQAKKNRLTPRGIQNPMPSPVECGIFRDPHGLRIWQHHRH